MFQKNFKKYSKNQNEKPIIQPKENIPNDLLIESFELKENALNKLKFLGRNEQALKELKSKYPNRKILMIFDDKKYLLIARLN